MDRRPARAGVDPEQLRPPPPIQALRDLTRTRKQLVCEITRHTQRIQKTLEDARTDPGELVFVARRSGVHGQGPRHFLLSVYLRELNVPVPSIYGPSDENPFAAAALSAAK